MTRWIDADELSLRVLCFKDDLGYPLTSNNTLCLLRLIGDMPTKPEEEPNDRI